MHKALVLAVMIGSVVAAHGQWALQESGTTASFRGVHYVGGGVAWVSGTGGTVLRTVDMGKTWVKCAVPEGAETLDFRGVQAFDAKTEVVMSSGPGDASRLYKTVDGCGTWKLVFVNPDKEGFWDALKFSREFGTNSVGWLLGDPVDGRFVMFFTEDKGDTWKRDSLSPETKNGSAFAASNSSLVLWGSFPRLLGGGGSGAPIYKATLHEKAPDWFGTLWVPHPSQLEAGTPGAGVFAIEPAVKWNMSGKGRGGRNPKASIAVAVGGNYEKPDDAMGTASRTTDDGSTWLPAQSSPKGYRSSVAYDDESKTWITVGPNGTDVSVDDGRNWRALKPGASDDAGANRGWNALSLPFVVGEHGRIGILRSDAVGAKDIKVSPR